MPPETAAEKLIRLQQELDLAKDLKEAYDRLSLAAGEQVGTDQRAAEVKLQLIEAQRAHLDHAMKQGPVTQNQVEKFEKLTEKAKKLTKELADLAKAEAELAEKTQAAVGQAKSLKNSLLGLSGPAGKIGAVAKAAGGDFGAFAGEMFKADTITGAFMKVIGTFVNNTIALAKEQDKAISAFRRATGATAEYNIQITQAERRNFLYGVSASDAGAATQTLFTSFSNFTNLTEGQKAGLIDTTALLQKLGVDASTSAKLMDQAMRASGKSVSETNDLMLDLAGSAQALGVSMQQMTSDFASNFGELAKYGDNAMEVFKGLAVQAKNSGLEVSTLIKIASQFDKFDSAAQSVGRLNAILGGPYLNSIDMLNASEEDRIEILSRSIEASGRQFDALGRFEQQAIASAMGTSVEEAQRLFNMSDEQYRLDAIKQEEMQELVRETQTMGQELKSMFMALAVDLRPLVDNVLKPLIGHMSSIAKWIGEGTNALGQFVKVGMFAAGLAAVIAAPFTSGASLLAFAAISGLTMGGLASMAPGSDESGTITPRLHEGGMHHEKSILKKDEMVLTGGSAEVLNKEGIADMISSAVTAAISAMPASTPPPTQEISLYVGQEKIDELVIKGMNSPAAAAAFGPFTNVSSALT